MHTIVQGLARRDADAAILSLLRARLSCLRGLVTRLGYHCRLKLVVINFAVAVRVHYLPQFLPLFGYLRRVAWRASTDIALQVGIIL